MALDIDRYAARSGRIIGEDGEIYNLVDLLKNAGGGGVDPENFYTKEEADGRFQPKGNYATTAQLNAKADQTALQALEAKVAELEAKVEELEGGG